MIAGWIFGRKARIFRQRTGTPAEEVLMKKKNSTESEEFRKTVRSKKRDDELDAVFGGDDEQRRLYGEGRDAEWFMNQPVGTDKKKRQMIEALEKELEKIKDKGR